MYPWFNLVKIFLDEVYSQLLLYTLQEEWQVSGIRPSAQLDMTKAAPTLLALAFPLILDILF
jgi:hypothetical protein